MEFWIQINNLVQIKLCIIIKSTPPSYDLPPFRDYVKCLLIPKSTLPSQNIPPSKHLYVTLQDCTPPSQNIHPPFKHFRSICDPPIIYPSLPEYTRLLYEATLLESTHTPLFTTMCNTPMIYPSLPEYTLPPLNIHATLPESTPRSLNISPPPLNRYATLPESTPSSQNRYPLFW